MQLKLYILLMLGLFISLSSEAQQVIQFSQFHNTTAYYHPGSAGIDPVVDLTGLYRNQWSGLPGNPTSQFISATFPLFDINSGAGVVLSNDVTGAQQDLMVRGMYNYQYELGNGKFTGGLYLGYMQKTLRGDELITPTGVYEPGNIDHNDDLLPAGKPSASSYDLGLGLYYSDEKLQIGLSGQHLISGGFNYQGNTEPFKISLVPQIVLSSFYKFSTNHTFDFQPLFNLKTDFDNHQAEIGVLVHYEDFIWGGLSYRGYNKYSFDAVIAMLGVAVTNEFNVGYSYDYPVSQLSAVNTGSHELFIRYSIPVLLPSKGKIINNPRFLSY